MNCHRTFSDEHDFCSRCGAKLTQNINEPKNATQSSDNKKPVDTLKSASQGNRSIASEKIVIFITALIVLVVLASMANLYLEMANNVNSIPTNTYTTSDMSRTDSTKDENASAKKATRSSDINVSRDDTNLNARISKIAFVSDRNGSYNIWSVNADGTGLIQLTNDGYNTQPEWSPDGKEIVWTKSDSVGKRATLWKMNFDGNRKIQLSSADGDGSSSWSPDGKTIMYRSDSSNKNGWFSVWMMNSDGSNQHIVNSGGTECEQDWSPDSKRIVFAQASYAGLVSDIFVTNIFGTTGKWIASHKPFCSRVAWSPDSQKIAYASEETGNRELYIINPDGTEKIRLTNNQYLDDFRPDDSSTVPRKIWSPDSKKILFVSNRDGDWDIYSIKIDGSGLTQQTNDSHKEYAAQWSPDGSKIAYISDKNEKNANIQVMDSEGLHQVQITDNVGNVKSIAWSPF